MPTRERCEQGKSRKETAQAGVKPQAPSSPRRLGHLWPAATLQPRGPGAGEKGGRQHPLCPKPRWGVRQLAWARRTPWHPPPLVSQLLLLGGRPCITKPTRTGRVASAPRAPASSALSSGKRTECETPRIREKLCGPGRKSLKTFLVQNHREMGSVEATPAFPPCDALPAGVTREGRHRLQAGQRLSFPRGRAQGAGDAKERRDGTGLAAARPSCSADPRPQPGFGRRQLGRQRGRPCGGSRQRQGRGLIPAAGEER